MRCCLNYSGTRFLSTANWHYSISCSVLNSFWKVMFKQMHRHTFNPLKNLLVRDKGVLFWPNRSLLRTFLPPYWIRAVTSWKGQHIRNFTSYFKNFTCVTFISHVAGYPYMIPESRYSHLIPWILEKFEVAPNRLNRNFEDDVERYILTFNHNSQTKCESHRLLWVVCA